MKSEEFRNDPLFLRNQFPGQGVAEIPLIHKTPFDLDNIQLIGYDQTKTDDASNMGSVVHFFQDDYKFECLWNNPKPRLSKLKQYAAIMTPQFSIYTEMPAALHMYNIFRSRWVGALPSAGTSCYPHCVLGPAAELLVLF